jgi:hypothetical protein
MRCMPMAILVASLPAILAGFVVTAAEPSPSAAVDTAFPGKTIRIARSMALRRRSSGR